ncbi:Fur-regulated basic protein FbpA [Aneurinibacillus terranovensis]|uniref:Fur-regulated basic protein FbpA n=1 Tax=Aneurinibacillus terranovensis TaxID=278991 RepID=UPI0004040181|nr:Fur-regulated basic protein FbpA [Aneurinibacillus terranovensis]
MKEIKNNAEKYIDRLLAVGIFKINGRQLYECSKKEIKQTLFNALSKKRKKRATQ